ncbi:MAG: P1 family peptidase [Clostridium sp.]|uniref:P1 family peptidase n=2 Tax=Clostridium sp. TaxID=1506 RepID=UPI002FCB1056
MKEITINSIDGIKFGNYSDLKSGTGCSVIISEDGASCGVDVRGGAPGTRETDLLDPSEMVEKVHGVVLSGGSAYGLDSCSGVMEFLEKKGIGFRVSSHIVPIVCGAVIFDLDTGDSTIRPNREMGYNACVNAYEDNEPIQGNIGAGVGATVGKILGHNNSMKGGLGMHALEINGLQVGAIVAVNAIGNIVCPETNENIAGPLVNGLISSTEDIMIKSFNPSTVYKGNTTIACIITNANFNKAQNKKIASMAHNGFARCIFPCHTMFDGDTIFSLSTGKIDADINLVGLLARKCVEKAIIKGVKSAESIFNIPSYEEIIKKN